MDEDAIVGTIFGADWNRLERPMLTKPNHFNKRRLKEERRRGRDASSPPPPLESQLTFPLFSVFFYGGVGLGRE